MKLLKKNGRITQGNRENSDLWVKGAAFDAPAASKEVVSLNARTSVANNRTGAMIQKDMRNRFALMRRTEAWDRKRWGYRLVKRVFDIAFSTLVIIVAFIPSVFLCLAICIDSPGAPLYRQKRVGRIGADGKPCEFYMWKFRSMVKDADVLKSQLMDRNEVDGPMFKMRDDPRVTRVGRFIRKHSIDEFPQFLNVFLGQMSVVGPRPPLPNEVAEYDGWAMQRLSVKPGLTGPWQVGGRSNVGFDDMVQMDLGYIAKRSIKTDLIIILQTVAVVFSGKGAA